MKTSIGYILILGVILISIFFQSCSRPIMILDLKADSDGYKMFGNIPTRNFFVEKTIQDSLEFLWEFETNGNQYSSSVLIVDKYLFINDLSGRVYVVDKNTGKLIGYEKIGASVSVSPILYNKRIFVATEQKEEDYSTFIVFDVVNSKILQEDNIKGAVTAEMIKLDDGIIVLSSSGELIRYNLIGTRVWSRKTNTFAKSTPVSDANIVLFGNEKGEIVCVDYKTGEILYRKKVAGRIEGGLTIDGTNCYFGDSNGVLYSLKIETGNINWSYQTGSKIISTPVFNTENIFVGNLGGNIFSIDKASGSLLWKTQTGGVINSTPLLFRNLLIQPNLNKQVNILDVEKGIINKTIPFERRVKLSPVYFDGILYLGADRGIIYAYKVFDKD